MSTITALPAPGRALKVKVLGTIFLLVQLFFALNNYGPHRVPGLKLFFSGPFLAPNAKPTWNGENLVRFADATEKAGLGSFTRPAFHDALPHYVEVMGGGVAVGDYDGDGWEDLLFTGMPSFDPARRDGARIALFRNRGDGSFADETRRSGLTRISGYPQGALFFDADNDGDSDLYVAAYDGGQYFRNDGGAFRDLTATAGLSLEGRCGSLPCFASSASAADYDRDGLLDLLIVNNVHWDLHDPAQQGTRQLFPAFFAPQHSFLFRNRGDGTFEDVTQKTGVNNHEGKGLAAVWADFNNDRWPDVYITNDLSRNTLYVNRGNGTFEESAAGAGVDEIKSSMGASVGDFDHDGHLDFAVTNLKGGKISLFRNLGDLRFDYATDYSGLAGSARASGWGIEFVDVDLDGHADLVSGGGPVWEKNPVDTQNLLFRNTGKQRFEDVSTTSGYLQDRGVSRGLALGDFDRDGWPDLVLARADGAAPLLLRNQANAGTNWLQLRLEGVKSNRDAVGARVEVVRADGLRLVEEVKAGGSYQSTSTRALFIGLGKSTAREIKIIWPSGTVQTLRDLPVNQIFHVREGSGTH